MGRRKGSKIGQVTKKMVTTVPKYSWKERKRRKKKHKKRRDEDKNLRQKCRQREMVLRMLILHIL